MIVHGARDEDSVEGEGVLLRNLVEHAAGVVELVGFGVESHEFRCKKVISGGGEENDLGVELLSLAREAAVGAALDEVGVESAVDGVAIGRWGL